MEECGMKSRSPVTRQGWRWWVLCGAGSAQRQDARLQRPGVTARAVSLSGQPQHCAVLQTALCLDTSHCTHHHHTSVGNTANGTHNHHLTYNLYLAGLVGWLGCTV